MNKIMKEVREHAVGLYGGKLSQTKGKAEERIWHSQGLARRLVSVRK